MKIIVMLIIVNLFYTSLIISCYSTRNIHTKGLVMVRDGFLIHATNKFVPDRIPEHKHLYLDSIVIEESGKIDIKHDSSGERYISSVDHYIYIDLPTRSFYEYKTFSDTAKFLKKYTQPDSVNVPFGWSFFKYRDIIPKENLQAITDTLISNIVYKRFMSNKKVQSTQGIITQYYLAYVRCDKKNSMFHFDRAFDEKIGCPATRFEFWDEGGKFSGVGEMEFVRETLTSEELKVFAAWERNAKLNPVK